VYFIMIVLCASFFFYSSSDHLELHSFPTRRSSDLRCCKEAMLIVAFFNTVIAPDNARDHQRHLEEEHMSTIGFIGVGEIASAMRSEEHTSELQSRFDLVCRLLLEKKKKDSNRQDNL